MTPGKFTPVEWLKYELENSHGDPELLQITWTDLDKLFNQALDKEADEYKSQYDGGYRDGINDGREEGYDEGHSIGYEEGYNDGRQ